MNRLRTLLACITFALALTGCKRESTDSSSTDASNTAADANQSSTVTPEPTAKLIFPLEVRVEDNDVNEALENAMTLCTKGEYESFRSVWSARETPLTEDRFDQMRQAVTRIEIQALKRAALKRTDDSNATETVYVAYARMDIDLERLPGNYTSLPADQQTEPQREAVLMLVREFDEWRLAHAPKKMRAWLKSQVTTG